MKVRIKFSKNGPMKFIGHLDTMRYFQKAIRRADLPVAYSEGFSPHMIMSFASPIGVGVTSDGEYFDLQLAESLPTAEITRRLDAAMAEGMSVLSTVKVEDGKASKAMSLVAAADYLVSFRPGKEFSPDWEEKFPAFMSQGTIEVLKKTKKREAVVDIRPYIYDWAVEEHKVRLRLDASSANYTKAEQVMEAFAAWLGVTPQPFAVLVHRLEVLADVGKGNHRFVSLESLGEEVE